MHASGLAPVYVSTPTLPLPPLFAAPPRQAGIHELQLRELIASFSSAIASQPDVCVVNTQLLAEISPPRAISLTAPGEVFLKTTELLPRMSMRGRPS